MGDVHGTLPMEMVQRCRYRAGTHVLETVSIQARLNWLNSAAMEEFPITLARSGPSRERGNAKDDHLLGIFNPIQRIRIRLKSQYSSFHSAGPTASKFTLNSSVLVLLPMMTLFSIIDV
jgi:hypothetical protein